MSTQLSNTIRIAGIGLVLATIRPIQATEITAFVEPYRDIQVSSPESGTLAIVHVQEGDMVSTGDLLAGLHEDVLRAALSMAETAMRGRGKLHASEVELRQQQQRLNKIRDLQKRRHASQEEVTRAQFQVESAIAQVQAARDEIDVKHAEYRRIRAQLETKRIRSPIDGVVIEVLKDRGEFVSANDPVVARVVQLDPLRVVFSVPAHQAKSILVNQRVEMEVGAARNKAEGIVEFVSPTADAQTSTTRVKVRIPNTDGTFQSGDPCTLVACAPSSPPAQQAKTRPENATTKPTSQSARQRQVK